MLIRAGVDLTPAYISPEQRAAMAASYTSGATVRELGLEHRLADSTVINVLLSAGVQLRRQGRRHGDRSRRLNPLTDEEILTIYNRGGIRDLTQALGSSVSTAYRLHAEAASTARNIDLDPAQVGR